MTLTNRQIAYLLKPLAADTRLVVQLYSKPVKVIKTKYRNTDIYTLTPNLSNSNHTVYSSITRSYLHKTRSKPVAYRTLFDHSKREKLESGEYEDKELDLAVEASKLVTADWPVLPNCELQKTKNYKKEHKLATSKEYNMESALPQSRLHTIWTATDPSAAINDDRLNPIQQLTPSLAKTSNSITHLKKIFTEHDKNALNRQKSTIQAQKISNNLILESVKNASTTTNLIASNRYQLTDIPNPSIYGLEFDTERHAQPELYDSKDMTDRLMSLLVDIKNDTILLNTKIAYKNYEHFQNSDVIKATGKYEQYHRVQHGINGFALAEYWSSAAVPAGNEQINYSSKEIPLETAVQPELLDNKIADKIYPTAFPKRKVQHGENVLYNDLIGQHEDALFNNDVPEMPDLEDHVLEDEEMHETSENADLRTEQPNRYTLKSTVLPVLGLVVIMYALYA